MSAVKDLLDVAITLHLQGDLTAALLCYGAVVDVDPDNEVANYNINSVFQETELRADRMRGEN